MCVPPLLFFVENGIILSFYLPLGHFLRQYLLQDFDFKLSFLECNASSTLHSRAIVYKVRSGGVSLTSNDGGTYSVDL